MRHKWKCATLLVSSVLSMATAAVAQPLGSFTWQLQPYCNRITLNVTATAGGVFTLDGFDDQCGAATRASASGIAFPNPDGTIGLGIVVLMTPGATPEHIDATVSLPSASGTWRNSVGAGTFALGQNAGGPARPNAISRLQLTRYQSFAEVNLRRANGTADAPAPILDGQALGQIYGSGWTGSEFNPGGWISFSSAGNWTPAARGTSIDFYTTPAGSNSFSFQMRIADNGRVGIGTVSPLDQLHVRGDIRVGTSGTGGCLKNNNGGTIVGTGCASDLRFKRDITSYPSMLDRVTSLRPVQFFWRSAEYADRGFGSAREAGLIAQEVEDVLPELVSTDADGYKAVDYSKLPLLTIQAVKELKAENDRLKEQNAALERRLATLETAILRR